MIPYGRQSIDEGDINTVVNSLKSNWLTQGPAVPAFEEALTLQSGAKHAVAVNSATSALHLACLALGVEKNDTVWTSPNSFVASANCALYCGAEVDFVDVEPTTGNMDVSALAAKLAQAKKHGTLPKALIPVHFAGQSCDMKAIAALAEKYHFRIIEDASHAIGAKYRDQPVGSCQYSDITVFSFHPVKIITTMEGGAALTNKSELARKIQLMRSHGVTAVQDEMTEVSHGPWYYQQVLLGFNYRMNDVEAALGTSQLRKLALFVEQRNVLAAFYDNAFEHQANITPLDVKSNCYSSYHLYVLRATRLNSETHKIAINTLRAKGIFAHVHYIPIHLQPFYQKLGFKKGDYPHAEQYYQHAITLPLYPSLTQEEAQYIVDTTIDVVNQLSS